LLANKSSKKRWHPLERIHVRAENALKVQIARRCRKLHTESAASRRNPRRKEEIERYNEQRGDCGVLRHATILN
jgi:hypothetical protein